MARSVLALLPSVLVLLASCGGGAPPAPPPAGDPAASAPAAAVPAVTPTDGALPQAAVDEARQIFATRCTPCHGAEGKGDGAASAALAPPPRNFQDAAWQASVTDAHVETIVKYGGASVGRAATMPGNPDLIAKPDVVKALRAHVRSLAR